MPEIFGSHAIEADVWFVGDLTYWDGSLGSLRRAGQSLAAMPVYAEAFAGLPTPEVGQRYYYSPRSQTVIRPYVAGDWTGSDGAAFFLGTRVSWFPSGRAASVVIDQSDDARFMPPDYYSAAGDGFGHLSDGADRESAVVFADEFAFVPDVLTPVFFRAQEAFGEPLAVSAVPDQSYGGRPSADVGMRFFFEAFDDIRGPSRAGNLRPIDPLTAGPRG